MSGVIGGGNNDAKKANKIAQQQAEAAQRRALADLATAQSQADQAKASTSRKRGRTLLTFLGADGQATLG
jgi:hypothetical protein